MSADGRLERHPLSAIWGDMPPAQFRELVEDVRQHGVREPIVCHDEMILDGWHRYRAAAKSAAECCFVDLPPAEDPAGFVIRHNAYRRHLTASQRAAMVVACTKWRPHGDQGRERSVPGTDREKGESTTAVKSRSTAAQMAQGAGVSESTIEHAKAAERAGLGEKVRSGEMSAKAAARKAKSKTGSTGSNKTKSILPASTAKLQAKVERLEEALTAARMEIEEKAAKIDELEERVAFIQAESSPVAAAREAKFNNYRAHIRTLKGSVGQWQTKFQESNTENRFLRRRLRALGENIRP